MDTKKLCSVHETAEILRIGRTKIYDMLAKGELHSIRIGSRRLIKMDSIRGLIDGATGGTA